MSLTDDEQKLLPCRMEMCNADAEVFAEHARHGEIAVCRTCSQLFEG